MEENVGLVVFEHLGNKLDIHVLDVDFLRSAISNERMEAKPDYLEVLIQEHDSFIEFLLQSGQWSHRSSIRASGKSYHVVDDPRK